jgi:hypothetical protein
MSERGLFYNLHAGLTVEANLSEMKRVLVKALLLRLCTCGAFLAADDVDKCNAIPHFIQPCFLRPVLFYRRSCTVTVKRKNDIVEMCFYCVR